MRCDILLLSLAMVGALGGPVLRPSGDKSADKAVGQERRKRSFSPLHHYVDTVYNMTKYEVGEWTLNDCNVVFNCETVSTHHCTDKGSQYECTDNKGKLHAIPQLKTALLTRSALLFCLSG